MTIAMNRLTQIAHPRRDRTRYLPFGPWRPDLSRLSGSHMTVATNVLPREDGYEPWHGLAALTEALPARGQGAFVGVNATTGERVFFAGTAAGLYTLNTADATWSDVSNAGGYSLSSEQRWKGIQYGARVIMVAPTEQPQSWLLGTSTLFSDLGGSPPQAHHAAVIREFVVLANLVDGANYPGRVRWSAIGDPTSWTPSATTQAGFTDLEGVGEVRAIVSGAEYGVVISENGVHRMDYVGSPSVFAFDKVEEARGTPAAGSVATVGRLTFYLGEDGFYVFDGTASQPIGYAHVDRHFFEDASQGEFSRVTAAIDPQNRYYFVSYRHGTDAGEPTRVLAYNYAIGRWSKAEINHEALITFAQPSYTLDTLDNLGLSLDDLPASLDSRVYSTTLLQAGAFDSSHKVALFGGSALPATLETADTTMGAHSKVIAARPYVETSAATVQASGRARSQDAVTYGPAATIGPDGECKLLAEGRFGRFRQNIPAAEMWGRAIGMETRSIQTGRA